ncbi:MAG: class I SAM-dependent methyltransferase, partial [Bacteroidetes bacterium]|nr:class I SAM-dependent methyltransferase [Bacteroidota bacterium]
MNDSINPEILKPAVQEFLHEHLKDDLQKLILKGSPFPNITVQELAIQIEGKNKSEKKLPTWFKSKGILFPPKLNLEQASSELTAKYKASLINKGRLIDLTGGFGIDDFAFADRAEKVFHCEINETLSAIVSNNAKVLKKDNIEFIIGDSQKFLAKTQKVETIYVDPSRRANSGRVFLLEDCEPDVLKHKDLYLQKAGTVIIKAAPMLDISAAVKSLKNVQEVHVVSLNNECKELLFVLKKTPAGFIKYYCTLLKGDDVNVYEFDEKQEKTLEIQPQKLQNYLYEPDAAILKAGFFKSLCPKFGVDKIHQHSHLYTSTELKADFPGKIFKVMDSFDFNQFTKSKALAKANVVTRNFNLKPEEIKKQFKI